MFRWKSFGIALLLVLTGGLIPGTLAQSPPMPGSPQQPPSRPSFDRESLFNRLNLTPQQRSQMTALMNEFEEKMRQLFSRLHEQRTQLANLYLQYELDERAAQRLQSSIRQTQGEILKVHHQHHKQLRRILTKEQFERWNQWWKERMFYPPKDGWGRRGHPKPE